MTYLERITSWRERQASQKVALLDIFGDLIERQTLSNESSAALLEELGIFHNLLSERSQDIKLDMALRAATQLPPTDGCFLLDSISSTDPTALNDAYSEMPNELGENLEHLVMLFSKADIFLGTFSNSALSTINKLVSNHAESSPNN